MSEAFVACNAKWIGNGEQPIRATMIAGVASDQRVERSHSPGSRARATTRSGGCKAERERKLAAHRKSLHGRKVHEIVAVGNTVILEKLSYKGWQKQYGRSVGLRAPGMFVAQLKRTVASTGGILIEVSPRQAKLSQFCHGCGRHVKKPLSQRWHECACGVGPVQRDLYSAFLACTLDQDHLLPSCAQAVILSGRCGGASAGRTRTGSATDERGAGLASKLWHPQSRSPSASKSERTHTRANLAAHAGQVGSVEGLLRTPRSLDVGVFSDGRNLNASDAGTHNVLVEWQLVHLAPLKGQLGVGSTITLLSVDKKTTETVTVVGVYRSTGFGGNIEPILATTDTVKALSPVGFEQTIFYMKIDTNHIGKALHTIAQVAPNAFVFNLANIGDFIDQYLNYMLLTLTTIAGLSLLAGVIIIANAVALAMLERRRELGILKSVGYTSRTVLSEVLIENGIIGAVGALLAMLLVTFAMSLLGKFVFKTSFDVNAIIVLALIAGAALLAMVTAAIVAFGAVRVRPLEVLRYE